MNLIREELKNPAEKMQFGISFMMLPQFADMNLTLQSLPEPFHTVEIPCQDAKESVKLCPGLHAGSLLESGLLEYLFSADSKFCTECAEGLSRTIRELASAGIRTGSLDLNPQVFLQEKKRSVLLGLLKHLAYVLEQTGFALLLPFRVPCGDPELKKQIPYFLQSSMIPQIKLQLDIHPHELSPGFQPMIEAGSILHEIRSIRFFCNMDSGNELIPEHILPWIQELAICGFSGTCFFVPVSASAEKLPVWCSTFAELLRKIGKES